MLASEDDYFGSTNVLFRISRLQFGHFARRLQNVIRHAGTAAEKGVARIVSTLVLGQLVHFRHCVTD